MDISNILKNSLDASALRSETISSNIANVNTSNYKAKRVEFENQLATALNLTTTKENHIGANTASQAQVTTDNTTSVNENGNNVDLDVEMVNQSTNELYYSSIVSQLNGRYQMLNYVLNN
ncbi:flagellar basal body rod protein FlgB [Liquorilactobacillus mali]|uniref:Flagellar basal body rod protein FlgB n=1 Tax=Liquorilactobacillus mali KCTC 3596 = DSM 20444 TaxID=1046596 RepID=J0L1Y2_9LACO|nr:flagellar basal body rod protein FlgB [Liquorilactobacillus mali]AJA34117.1 flagellar basal-body rod protein FlgB [Liquorilactobacillus mali KCTC 3596 = DSM 20444]EJF02192.1 flagellar basal-body rod protein FlgB [Liquorilactobacillus mali KCTC 3596 = DSM 20444]KRN11140.1 flagellar basal-body rod protein [Liquorilactobacillus mali KCTC 3596 = DSM 20444]QFQ75872.1 flagellar basal body rod protein FlgB [Liquorilactobacillus mali]